MAGYFGFKMSNNAVAAYANGEMPFSKWTKKAILERVEEIADDLDIDIAPLGLGELYRKELCELFLYESSWHHTSKMYNYTTFYSIKDVDLVTKEDVDWMKAKRPPRKRPVRRSREEIEREKAEKEERNELAVKLTLIYWSGITGLKTKTGVFNRWKYGKLNVDKELDNIFERDSINKRWQKDVLERFSADKRAYLERKYYSAETYRLFRRKIKSVKLR